MHGRVVAGYERCMQTSAGLCRYCQAVPSVQSGCSSARPYTITPSSPAVVASCVLREVRQCASMFEILYPCRRKSEEAHGQRACLQKPVARTVCIGIRAPGMQRCSGRRHARASPRPESRRGPRACRHRPAARGSANPACLLCFPQPRPPPQPLPPGAAAARQNVVQSPAAAAGASRPTARYDGFLHHILDELLNSSDRATKDVCRAGPCTTA